MLTDGQLLIYVADAVSTSIRCLWAVPENLMRVELAITPEPYVKSHKGPLFGLPDFRFHSKSEPFANDH